MEFLILSLKPQIQAFLRETAIRKAAFHAKITLDRNLIMDYYSDCRNWDRGGG